MAELRVRLRVHGRVQGVFYRGAARAQALLALASLVLAAALIEAGTRVWLHHLASAEQLERYALYGEMAPGRYRWSPHHYLDYVPTPNYSKGLTRHNSLGFRGGEFPVHKPPGVFRIVALGGSTIYDARIEDDTLTFPAQLERVLRERHGYVHVQVVNGGVSGYTSWESLVNFEFRVLDLEPDLVIDYDALNDIHARLVLPEAYRGDNSGQRQPWRAPPIRWWERSCALRIAGRRLTHAPRIGLETLVNGPAYWAVRRKPSKPPSQGTLLAANPPIFFERNLQSLVAVARANRVGIVLATFAYSRRLRDYTSTRPYRSALREHNEIIRRVAQSRQVPLFDFAGVMPEDPEYWADGRHSNEKGARLKAELFADFMVQSHLIPNRPPGLAAAN